MGDFVSRNTASYTANEQLLRVIPRYRVLIKMGDLKEIETAVFDLDGTLIVQDSLYEQLKAIAKFSMLKFLSSFLTLAIEGRVSFKKAVFQINEEYDFNYSSLSKIRVNEKVQGEFYKYKNNGVTVIIATAAYWKTALKVLRKIELYPDILLSTRHKHNLKGKVKLKYILPHINDTSWAYYGDSKSDVPLFNAADIAYRVNSKEIIEHLTNHF